MSVCERKQKNKDPEAHKMLFSFQGKALKLFHFWGCMAERGGATPHIATLENNICTETEPLGPASFSLMSLVLTKVEERHIIPLLLHFPGTCNKDAMYVHYVHL